MVAVWKRENLSPEHSQCSVGCVCGHIFEVSGCVYAEFENALVRKKSIPAVGACVRVCG